MRAARHERALVARALAVFANRSQATAWRGWVACAARRRRARVLCARADEHAATRALARRFAVLCGAVRSGRAARAALARMGLRQHARRRGVALRAWRSTAARRARATLAASSKAAMSCAVKQALAAQRKVLESQRGDSIESVTAALRSTYDAQLAALRVDLAAALALATQLREEKVCERASEKNAFSAALVEALGEQRALLEGERVAALELQEQRVRAEFDEVRCNFFCLLPFFCLLILSFVCSLLIFCSFVRGRSCARCTR